MPLDISIHLAYPFTDIALQPRNEMRQAVRGRLRLVEIAKILLKKISQLLKINFEWGNLPHSERHRVKSSLCYAALNVKRFYFVLYTTDLILESQESLGGESLFRLVYPGSAKILNLTISIRYWFPKRKVLTVGIDLSLKVQWPLVGKASCPLQKWP
jgi:hypothetical protein